MRLDRIFYERDVLEVAPDLLGKVLVGEKVSGIITEVEAYRGEEDLACHARFGKTKRNEVMYGEAGHVYMYLIYGMYWMLNVVTGKLDDPQAVLIRGVGDFTGPGKVTRVFGLDKSFYGEDLVTSERIWIEPSCAKASEGCQIISTHRVGVEYSGKWAKKKWRWVQGL